MKEPSGTVGTGDCTAVIVSWNCREHLADCLTSLRGCAPGMDVIVVDNESGDGTPEMVRHRFPEVRLIEAGSNLGFAAANNIGARSAHSQLLLFLNPDTVVTPGAVETMAAAIGPGPASRVALVGPRLEFPDGRDQPSAFGRYPGLFEHALIFNPIALAVIRRVRPGWDRSLLVPQPRQMTTVAHVNGAAMLTSAEAFNRVGGFDEGFFVYFEETDLCRSYQEAGYEISFVPEATIVHHMGGSSGENEIGQSSPLHLESMYRFYRKHYGRLYAGAAFIAALSGLTINAVLLRAAGALGGQLGRSRVARSAETWTKFTSRALRWHLRGFGTAVLSGSRT